LTKTIDLRSDTVTKPTDEMRAAMASAEVGDDVYGEDPTVLRLEARAAEIFGREAALFVPSGTMGNQIAIRLHTQPGQEVVCESRAHIVEWEMAMLSAFSGVMPRTIFAERGILTWPQIEAALSPKLYYRAQTGLISLENTHNMAGGTVTPLNFLRPILEGAKGAGVPVHLDGARVFNAALALGLSVAELTRGFDTVMFCLSKGLCAPVGSMLVGTRAHMEQARIFRKALGGGLRQVGVLAAAGLIALEEMPSRLHEDHANARLIADLLLSDSVVVLDLSTVETNILIFEPRSAKNTEVVRLAKARGVLASAFGTNSIRLVTHRDVSAEDCTVAAQVLTECIRQACVTGQRQLV
jgi:threonine aldolase